MVLGRPEVLKDILNVLVGVHLMVCCAWAYVVLTNSSSQLVALERAWIDEIQVQLARLHEFHVNICRVQLLLTHLLIVETLRIRLPVVGSRIALIESITYRGVV